MEFPQKLKIELGGLREGAAQWRSTCKRCARSYVALIPRTGKKKALHNQRKMASVHRAASCSVCIAVVFIIGQIQHQPLCSLLNEWQGKMCADRILSSLQKKKVFSAFNNRGDSGGHYAKWNKLGPGRQMPHDFIYIQSLKELNYEIWRAGVLLLGRVF